MTDLKPKIFIGSSTPGRDIALKVKKQLSESNDCYVWSDLQEWDPGKSIFGNLIQMGSYFDFGVFVATADDLSLKKEKMVITARDNVILEMGLFCGTLGRDKSLLLVEEGTYLPTDLDGIYYPRFKKEDEGSISLACEKIIIKIAEQYKLGHLSLYPTTALAIGYFKNFIAEISESIHSEPEVEVDGVLFNQFKLNVVLPADLKGNIRDKAKMFYARHELKEAKMKTKYRSHPAWFKIDTSMAPSAIIYDMPSTLTGIDDAIEMILHKNFYGRTTLQDVIDQRELNNFRRVLQSEIDYNDYAKGTVEIIDEF